jgi:hypothetical protein
MKAWLWIAATVAAVDTHAALTGKQTLSFSYRSTARTHPVAVTAATVYLICHLYGLLPRRMDPLCVFDRQLRKATA